MGTQVACVGGAVVDDYALARIDHRVRCLAKRFDLREDQQEDFRQDMVVELLSAFARFSPKKAKRETFINRVLDRFVKHTIRAKYARQRRACDNPIRLDNIAPGFQPVVNDPRAGELSEQGQRDLRLDLAAAISRMPCRLQRVCRLLMASRPAEAAGRLGIRRQSIYRNIAEIRACLTEAGLEISKNTATNSLRLQM